MKPLICLAKSFKMKVKSLACAPAVIISLCRGMFSPNPGLDIVESLISTPKSKVNNAISPRFDSHSATSFNTHTQEFACVQVPPLCL